MPKPNDLHHLAISTGDVKAQIEFFSDVLGMELVALYWMHGADNTFHAFLKLHDTASVAFVQTPDNRTIIFGTSENLDGKLAVLDALLKDNTAFTLLDLRPSTPFYRNDTPEQATPTEAAP